jgi:hypothetical protein
MKEFLYLFRGGEDPHEMERKPPELPNNFKSMGIYV